MSSKLPDLTTTSYAILGLLTIKPWSTYELAKQMQRDRFVWPRAESNLYAEPKKLIAHGFASAHSEPRGKRRRTVYSITPAGKLALADWLGKPAAEPRWEAVNGQVHLRDRRLEGTATREPPRLPPARNRSLGSCRGDLPSLSRGQRAIPDRTHLNVLPGSLLETARLQAEWADRTIEGGPKWHTTAEPQDHAATLAALKAEIAAGAP